MSGLVAIVGPTAVGKTAAGIALAERVGGEIVSADSRCVYRGMDIGTAKPTQEERARAPHHLIDLIDPDEDYSVARFLEDAAAAIDDIRARGRLPIVVGGTGYWVAALLGGATSAGVPPNLELRDELGRLSLDELAARLGRSDPAALATIDVKNPRRLIRAIEVVETTGRPYTEARVVRSAPADASASAGEPTGGRGQAPALREPIESGSGSTAGPEPIGAEPDGAAGPRAIGAAGVVVIGLTMPREKLYARIGQRYDAMLAAGWLGEVRGLLARGYGRDLPSMSSLGYRELAAHLAGELTLEQAIEETKARCRRYARMQYNWFRLDDSRTKWIEAGPGAHDEMARLVEGEGTA